MQSVLHFFKKRFPFPNHNLMHIIFQFLQSVLTYVNVCATPAHPKKTRKKGKSAHAAQENSVPATPAHTKIRKTLKGKECTGSAKKH